MRIAYICRWDIGRETGPLKKIAEHVRTWAELGHDVRLFAITPGHDIWTGIRDLPIEPFHGDGFLTRLTWRSHVAGPILRWKPDILYYRFGIYYPAIDQVQKKIASIVEMNSDDIAEYRLAYPRILYWAHCLLRDRIVAKASALICVTNEIAERQRNSRFNKPVLVLGNGISLEHHPPFPAPNQQPPRLIFVSTPNCAWNGMDRVVAMARLLPETRFDVVGYGPADVDEVCPPNLHLHGYLGKDQYGALMEKADVAISTLGMFRKSMEEACPLKTREYLARGVPTIIGYCDTDFPDGHPLLLRLANTPTNVEDGIGAIREFLTRAVGQRVPRADVAHLDVHVKERIRLEFMERVARQSVLSH
jgi:hypothetical protein